MVTEIGRLIDAYMDAIEAQIGYRPTQTAIARRLGVSRAAVSKWHGGTATPRPDHLRALAGLLNVPYSRLTDAVMIDQGYYEPRGDTYDAAPKTAAEWDRKRGELRSGGRPLTEAEVVQAIGPRPGEVRPPARRKSAGSEGAGGGERAVG